MSKNKLRFDIAPYLPRSSMISLASLAKEIHKGKLTLALGAGVSASSGLPSWIALLRKIVSTYLTHWELEKSRGNATNSSPPTNLSVAFWDECNWSDKTKMAANDLVAQEDALRLAQMIKARIQPRDWIYLVRKSLYGDSLTLNPSALLAEIAVLCKECADNTEILSYNYDNLAEMALQQLGVRANCIWEPAAPKNTGAIPIYYPHGHLKCGGDPLGSIVLGEDDYSEYAVDQLSWNNSVQLQQFLSTTCLFVGFSLTDPQVRRLLWVSKRNGRINHYAFLPFATIKDDKTEMLESLFDAQLRDVNVNVIRYCAGKDGQDHSRLPELIRLLRNLRNTPSLLWT